MGSGYTPINSPTFTEKNGILKRHQGCGTGCWIDQYYDTVNRIRSQPFESPIASNDKLIVYFDYHDEGITLVVQDIFDRQTYYKEFKRDFQFKYSPFINAEFISGGRQLRITYMTGLDKHEVTETLDLY